MTQIRIGTKDKQEFTYSTDIYTFGVEYMYQGDSLVIITKSPLVRHYIFALSDVLFIDII